MGKAKTHRGSSLKNPLSGTQATDRVGFFLIEALERQDNHSLFWLPLEHALGILPTLDLPEQERKEPMLSKKMAMLIMKISFCVATAIVLWATPASLFAASSPQIFCPPRCLPTGFQFCICP
jgi:hypothetical protein